MPSSTSATTTSTPRTSSRGSGRSSRRSRSGHRSRSRHRDRESRSHSRYRNRFRFKHKERNFAAAVCSMIAIVVMCVALAEPKWISLKGGRCGLEYRTPGGLHFLGVFQFFYAGHFISPSQYKYGTSHTDIMTNCVTYKAVILFKAMIVMTFLGILCSLGAFLLDLIGCVNQVFKLLHRNAILSILTSVLCVIVNMFCYWILTVVEKLQKDTKLHFGSKVEVTFDVSFYLITAAGSMSVFAVACNCLRRYPIYEDSHVTPLTDDYDDLEALISRNPDMSQMLHMPPPPPYTPSPTSTTTATTNSTSAASSPTAAIIT